MNGAVGRAVDGMMMSVRHLASTATVLVGVIAMTACEGFSPESSAGSVAAETQAVAAEDPSAAKDARAPFAGVPVVVFHGICPTTCKPSETYSISSAAFDDLLTALSARGYQTLSAHDYAQFLLGRAKNLPPRPILITFDDGRSDGYLGADPILARLHMRATTFIITKVIKDTRGYYMSWPDIVEAGASGRWDIQLHAHEGHATVPIGPPDEQGLVPTGSAYAWRRWVADGKGSGALESFEEWHARVASDFTTGEAMLRSRVPSYAPLLFAVPFGDYGEFGTNDPGISPMLRRELDGRFLAWFTQESSHPAFTPPVPHAEHHRLRVDASVTNDAVLSWLARHGG